MSLRRLGAAARIERLRIEAVRRVGIGARAGSCGIRARGFVRGAHAARASGAVHRIDRSRAAHDARAPPAGAVRPRANRMAREPRAGVRGRRSMAESPALPLGCVRRIEVQPRRARVGPGDRAAFGRRRARRVCARAARERDLACGRARSRSSRSAVPAARAHCRPSAHESLALSCGRAERDRQLVERRSNGSCGVSRARVMRCRSRCSVLRLAPTRTNSHRTPSFAVATRGERSMAALPTGRSRMSHLLPAPESSNHGPH